MNNTFANIEYVQPFGLTEEACTVSINFSNALNAYIGNSVVITNKIKSQKFRQFLQLKNKWEEETLFISSGTQIISNSAYIEIISFGKEAIPWILRELKKTNDHWFFALEKITGVNPIKNENIGVVEKMKEDWIVWATNNEYL